MERGIVRARVGLSYDPLRLSPCSAICATTATNRAGNFLVSRNAPRTHPTYKQPTQHSPFLPKQPHKYLLPLLTNGLGFGYLENPWEESLMRIRALLTHTSQHLLLERSKILAARLGKWIQYRNCGIDRTYNRIPSLTYSFYFRHTEIRSVIYISKARNIV